jgi:3-hydroxyisobutyrate dehydrogenase-like beta-hydroxyacid dehydrogenase
VITMLPTAEVILDLVEPLLNDWPQNTIWLQMSSAGAAEADQLTQAAKAHAVTLVDAPVSGSTHPAQEGQLTILASGPDSARTAVEPIFDALASRVLWVGAAGMGSRLKLAANHWMITMVAALAESMHLCQVMGTSLGASRPLGPATHRRCTAGVQLPASSVQESEGRGPRASIRSRSDSRLRLSSHQIGAQRK